MILLLKIIYKIFSIIRIAQNARYFLHLVYGITCRGWLLTGIVFTYNLTYQWKK